MKTFTITTTDGIACEIVATIGRRINELREQEKDLRAKADRTEPTNLASMADACAYTADGLRKIHTELLEQLND